MGTPYHFGTSFPVFCLLVHLCIIFLIITACDIRHPVLMLKIPLDGLADAVLKHRLRLPANLRLDLVRRDGVASVMSLSVLHIGDQILRDELLSRVIISELLLKGLKDDMDDLDILFLIVSAYIIRLKQPALLLYHVDRLGVVLDIEPVAHVLAIPIYRKLLAVKRIVDNQRNQLLRELVRPVIVGTVCDICRKMIGIHIGFHQHVRGCLARRIRAVRRIGRRLIEISAVLLKRTIHLIG